MINKLKGTYSNDQIIDELEKEITSLGKQQELENAFGQLKNLAGGEAEAQETINAVMAEVGSKGYT